MQPQPHIVTRGQYRVHVRGKVHQQLGELRECCWRGQLVKIINNQRDVATSIGELRQHPVDHRRRIEVRCRCLRFRAAAAVADGPRRAGRARTAGRRAGRVAPTARRAGAAARTVGPRAQQRRLPAASRSRDDRHLPGRRAIQGGEKIIPVDQPGSCWSHRQRAAFVSRASRPGTFPSLPGQRACCQRRAKTDLHPLGALQPRVANHRDPVMASHMAGGKL